MNLSISDSVEVIESSAFADCLGLETVSLGQNVETINTGAFFGCSNLKNVNFSNLNTIGDYAFLGCSLLQSIDIPDSVTSIGTNAFYGCSALTSIEVATNNSVYAAATNIGDSGTVIIEKEDGKTELDSNCSNIVGCLVCGDIILPDNILEIANNSFFGCASLKSIIISESIVSLDSYCFAFCSKLETITFWPEDCPKLADGCFSGLNENATFYYPFGNDQTYFEDAKGYDTSGINNYKFGETQGIEINLYYGNEIELKQQITYDQSIDENGTLIASGYIARDDDDDCIVNDVTYMLDVTEDDKNNYGFEINSASDEIKYKGGPVEQDTIYQLQLQNIDIKTLPFLLTL